MPRPIREIGVICGCTRMAPERDDFRWHHEFRPGDLGRMIAWHGEVYAREFGWPGANFEVMVAEGLAGFARTLPGRAAAGRDRLWVAEEVGDGGGYAGSVAISGSEEAGARLRWLMVAPAHRGRGLGRRLVGEALAWCRARGFGSVRLFTTGEQAAAIRLYKTLGFQKTGEEHHSRWGLPVVQEWYELRF